MSEGRKHQYFFIFLIWAVLACPVFTYAEIPSQWLGEYKVSDVDRQNAPQLSITLSDLNLDLIKERLGFEARWIKFEGNEDNQMLRSQSRSNSYLERGQKNVFFTPSTGKIYAGEEFSWAQQTDKELILYAINTDPQGRYILTTYRLIPDGQNFKFHLTVIVENKNYGEVKGTLVKKRK